jgi:hypothetical protein
MINMNWEKKYVQQRAQEAFEIVKVRRMTWHPVVRGSEKKNDH